MSMITAISQAHHKGRHFETRPLDNTNWDRLGSGQTFHVSRSNLHFETVSATNSKAIKTMGRKIVVKKTRDASMSENDIRMFNKELRILAHIFDLPSPSSQPAFMFEEAAKTLGDLVDIDLKLITKGLMSVFHNVANGVSALHDCGIAHGDLKPENIPLFQDFRPNEGVLVEIYIAKILDFSLAMFGNGELQVPLGGTVYYQASEARSGDPLAFPQLNLCDIYSLGMLYAVVASGSEDILESSVTHILRDEPDVIDRLETTIIAYSDNDVEGSTVDAILKSLVHDLFSCTLQISPLYGRLDILESFSLVNLGSLFDPDPADLTISYDKLAGLSGVLKDKMVKIIQHIAVDHCDPRYSKALFELAVMNLSQYASPTASIQEGLKYMELSAKEDDVRAKGFFYRVRQEFEAMPDELVMSDKEIHWLFEAASAGHQAAIDDLKKIDLVESNKALRKPADKSIGNLLGLNSAMQNTYRRQISEISKERIPITAITEITIPMLPDKLVHWTVATGNINLLLTLLRECSDCKDIRNNLGDTPLLSANFDYVEASDLLTELLNGGADPHQTAKGYGTSIFLDVLPRYLEVQSSEWQVAMRLQHTEIQSFLVEYASTAENGDTEEESVLRPLYKVRWDYKGTRHSYLDGAILGWILQTGYGIDFPVRIWRPLCHGKNSKSSLETSVWTVLCLDRTNVQFDEKLLDGALELAIDEFDYDAFELLLTIKVDATSGVHGRLTSLRSLLWKEAVPHNQYERKQSDEKKSEDSILLQVYAKPNQDDLLSRKQVISQSIIFVLIAFRPILAPPVACIDRVTDHSEWSLKPRLLDILIPDKGGLKLGIMTVEQPIRSSAVLNRLDRIDICRIPERFIGTILPGAWHRPEIYSGVIAFLTKHGYPSITLPLPSAGATPPHQDFNGDVDAIRKSLTELVLYEKEVVLVVHSYTGLPGGEAPEGLGKKVREQKGLKGGVIRYVVINGFATPAGFQCVPKGQYDQFPDWMNVDVDKGVVNVSLEDAKKIFYNDLPSYEGDALAAKLLPQSLGVYSSPATYAAWSDIPSTFLVGDTDQSSFTPQVVDMMIKGAQQLQPNAFDVIEHCEKGGHCLMISFPEWTANALRRAAGTRKCDNLKLTLSPSQLPGKGFFVVSGIKDSVICYPGDSPPILGSSHHTALIIPRKELICSFQNDASTLSVEGRPQLFAPSEYSNKLKGSKNRGDWCWNRLTSLSALHRIWLIELARTLGPEVKLEGLDISFDQFPPREWLPGNVSLVKYDAFSEPPAELLNTYDIIHVQLLITLIKDDNPAPMLKNLIKMLKPGGYLTWREWDVAIWEVIRVQLGACDYYRPKAI
ncbi:hypothetical protein G7Y89_g3365 [Cudoniella acicularis]|uniref:Protein kinase domain-containing protein n=1 Tax=Cudoniella acicularis TaxID=354080 RepID=A0A8H4RSQ4_9HELO|nr:hypothetical protein G7Y89_g3365 [Cudoniella acicularis]